MLFKDVMSKELNVYSQVYRDICKKVVSDSEVLISKFSVGLNNISGMNSKDMLVYLQRRNNWKRQSYFTEIEFLIFQFNPWITTLPFFPLTKFFASFNASACVLYIPLLLTFHSFLQYHCPSFLDTW